MTKNIFYMTQKELEEKYTKYLHKKVRMRSITPGCGNKIGYITVTTKFNQTPLRFHWNDNGVEQTVPIYECEVDYIFEVEEIK